MPRRTRHRRARAPRALLDCALLDCARIACALLPALLVLAGCQPALGAGAARDWLQNLGRVRVQGADATPYSATNIDGYVDGFIVATPELETYGAAERFARVSILVAVPR